ncbi:hypothetical protein [Cohnella cholangitidis]|uniref:Uncharacterized protein n=1 Tax=Cohnella cholangitidis TaxID=2598458 RepID=A0A7G5BXX2_9BACL|nr:hypothetical protein [Cohnella cholangitidis]QMV41806.1 hypothetical protein FPL14_11895 [Cohnella cholangitidis]
MGLNKKLVVKSGVGRALLDTSKQGCQLALEPSERGWTMKIGNVGKELAEQIEGLAQEIHCFYYEDDEERQHHFKWWLSDPDCPVIAYESGANKLTIEVSERIGFTVDSSEHGVK